MGFKQMADFLQALQTYHGGNKSIDELFGESDQLVKHEGTSATWMLATLARENAQNPLPPYALEAIKRRLKSIFNKNPVYQTNSSQSGNMVEIEASYRTWRVFYGREAN